jgi:molecular chaperone GrpE
MTPLGRGSARGRLRFAMKKKIDKNGSRFDNEHGGDSDADRDVRDSSAEATGSETAREGDADAPRAPGTETRADVAALVAERDRAVDQLKRALADLQNIRKRHAKELDDMRKRAIEELATKLLPVLDNFHLALATHEQHEAPAGKSDAHALVEGLRMVRKLLQDALAQHGLAELPALGQPFDPNIHEAVGVDPEAEVAPGHVSRVMQQGYSLGERVLRPARVFVAAERTEPDEASTDLDRSDDS